MEAYGEPTGRPVRRGPSTALVVFVAIIFGALSGFGGMVFALWAAREGHLDFLQGVIAVPQATRPAGASPQPVVFSNGASFAEIAKQLNESVVNVNTKARIQNPLSMLFGSGSQEVTGLGTGVIVDNNGHILTNYHVVGEADTITVTVLGKDGPKEHDATLVGGDKQEDLAVLKIDARGLKPVRFGDSDALQPAEPVMAIGNPFGFEHTVSVGVVSALNRGLQVDPTMRLRGMIQTDASINPGNSGGPLVNAKGEVVGINSAIFLGSGMGQPQANSIGFAIPSNRAKNVMEQLIAGGKVKHPYIGISYALLTAEVRRKQHLPMKSGVIVTNIYKGGPADKAGVRAGDVILSVDGKELREENTLSDHITAQEVGAVVKLDAQRWDERNSDWTQQTFSVKIQDMPKDFYQKLSEDKKPPEQNQPQGGGGPSFPFPIPF